MTSESVGLDKFRSKTAYFLAYLKISPPMLRQLQLSLNSDDTFSKQISIEHFLDPIALTFRKIGLSYVTSEYEGQDKFWTKTAYFIAYLNIS